MNKKSEIATTRRDTIKFLISLSCSVYLLPVNLARAASEKSLVVFFSWSGNTRKVAEIIAKKTGGALLELKTVKPYPTGYSEVGAVVKKE